MGGLSSFFFFLWLLLLLKKEFEGLIDIFPLYWGSGGPPSENFGKSRMQEKPSTTFLRLILYIFIFINQYSLCFSAILYNFHVILYILSPHYSPISNVFVLIIL